MIPEPGNGPITPTPARQSNAIVGLIVLLGGVVILWLIAVCVLPLGVVGVFMGPPLSKMMSATSQAHGTQIAAPAATSIAANTQMALESLPAGAMPAFIETFDTNQNGWQDTARYDGSASSTGRLENGQYTFGETGDLYNSIWWSLPGTLNAMPSSFYESVEARQIKGEPDSGYGLVLNQSNDHKNWVVFQLADNGYFRIRLKQNGEYSTPVYWTRVDAINKGGWNRLTVREQKTHYQFFINSVLVYETNSIGKPGPFTGLVIDAEGATEQSFQFDNFTLYSLPD